MCLVTFNSVNYINYLHFTNNNNKNNVENRDVNMKVVILKSMMTLLTGKMLHYDVIRHDTGDVTL